MKEDIKKFYDNWYPETLPCYIQTLMELEEKLVLNTVEELKEYRDIKKEGGRVLDCGCGFGSYFSLTRDLDTLYLDLSYHQLKRFGRRHRLNSNRICGDILNLPFKDNTFDLILCINVLEHVRDIRRGLRELHRVLKDRGVAIVVVVNRDSIVREEIFNDFKIYHRALSLRDFEMEGFKIERYVTFYFLHPIFKVLPVSLLRYFIDKLYLKLDYRLRDIFRGGGQFLCVVLRKC
ncbi:MAG TPA: class I SAM-dependent methyltransferase [Methanothermococcus okinawensis]|uniref:Class I SAM-dependent methyltransferase n=1 Tax=Methanothermococcus okinawensis TaxID=155863 RepID=A0A832ZBH3_9EURY|nr:class I SAM-dependent methyltransferase [Methanothermococcus okinawensis]